LLGAAIGSGKDNDAAKVAEWLHLKKQSYYGWRYTVKSKDELHVVDT